MLLVGAAGPARALSVLPGQAFEVAFAFSAAPQSNLGDVDVLAFTANGLSAGVVDYDVELWDGGTLLATNTRTALGLFCFEDDAGSVWNLNVVTAVLDTIIDGSFVGVVRLVPNFDPAASSPFLDLTFASATGLQTGTALTANSFDPGVPAPTIVSTGVSSVPEPAGVALLLLAAGWARRRLRS